MPSSYPSYDGTLKLYSFERHLLALAYEAGNRSDADRAKVLTALAAAAEGFGKPERVASLVAQFAARFDKGAEDYRFELAADMYCAQQTLEAERAHDRYLEDRAEQRDGGYWGD